MKTPAVLGTVALTELTAHFLSLGWGLMTLLAAFAWVALSGASVAAKARSTEDRVAALVPVIGTASALATNALPKSGGTVTGGLTVNGAHTVNGTLTANSGIEAASMHSSGNIQVDGSHTVNGNTYAAGGITGSGGGTLEVPSSIHANNTVEGDGNIQGGSISGSNYSAPQSRPPNPAATLSSLQVSLTDLITALANSGIIS